MSDFTPQGDINLRDTYAIDGATNITALEFYGDGSNLTGIGLDKALGDLTDVTITSVADNEFLIYDNASSKWINKTSTEIGFATVATSGLYSDLTGNPTIPDQLSDLSDDTTHRTVTDTEKSTWNGKQDTLVADTDYLTPGTAGTTYEPLKGIGDNYVTDADITLLGNTSNTNTGDQDIDGIGTNATAIALNTTHRTGDGSDHADVATNTSDIATNVIAIGLNTAKETNIVHPLVEKAVPSDALFTDTVYDDTTIQSEVALNTTHRGLTNNPHSVDKTDVGLSNVPNIDCTNASNLSSGTVPSAVLPPVALTSVQTAVSEITMLALTTEEGDVVVRSDENKSYMRNDGTAGDMTDFTELQTPTDSVLSVNGETGTVVLTTGDIGVDADSNYVTDAQVTLLGQTTNTNSGDNSRNSQYSGLVSNVSTNLSLGTKTATTIDVNSSDGTNATLPEADTTNAGILGSDKWDEIVANSNKISYNSTASTKLGTIEESADVTDATNVVSSLSAATLTGALTAADHGTAATDQVVNVSYGTGSPPTANTTTIGSLFVKYIA